jgi:osmoprotectant transport system permease protein
MGVTLLVVGAPAVVSAQQPKCYSRDINAWICGDYWVDRQDEIVEATTVHIQITVAAVLLGLAIAFPLALLARSVPRLESSVLAGSTAVYTVPSLALLPLLVPLTGLTKTTVIGYGSARLLLRVELPLALPVLMAGLRVATVSTVALTTIGTVVSEGGLGYLIANGQSTEFNAELFAGAVLCVALALTLDLLLVLAERLATPWRRGVSA